MDHWVISPKGKKTGLLKPKRKSEGHEDQKRAGGGQQSNRRPFPSNPGTHQRGLLLYPSKEGPRQTPPQPPAKPPRQGRGCLGWASLPLASWGDPRLMGGGCRNATNQETQVRFGGGGLVQETPPQAERGEGTPGCPGGTPVSPPYPGPSRAHRLRPRPAGSPAAPAPPAAPTSSLRWG